MNIINKLTLRHMKLNRKRTLVTMLGIQKREIQKLHNV